MTPGQTSEQGQLLEIDHPYGGRRPAAHVFDLPGGGIAWADHGWSMPQFSGHAFHVLPGEVFVVKPYPGWLLISPTLGDISIELIPGEPDGDRALAKRQIEADLEITL